MNKFHFMLKQETAVVEPVAISSLFYKDFNKTFVFSTYSDEIVDDRVVADRYEGLQRSTRTPGRIVKSDIQNDVVKQLKNMFDEIKNAGEQILYLSMNKNTKGFFRMYYSYEVDHIPRNLTSEDRQIRKVLGSIMGVKILVDNQLENYIVKPIVRHEPVKKFSTLFKGDL